VGVDVFLVISGYLIGSLVYRDVCEGRFSFSRFYQRRVKRILPALLAVLLACNIIAFVLLSPLELRDYCAQSFAAVTSTSNIFYWLRSNYFNPITALKPLLMTWSLGIEEQFYLHFPISLLVAHKFARRRVFQCVAVACVLSFAGCLLCLKVYPAAAFYLLPTRAWELGLGILIAIYEVQYAGPVRLGSVAANALGWLGLALIAISVLAYTESTHFPGFAALLPTLGTACLINSRDSFVNRKMLSARPMVFVGLVSYSWYLWHWPLMSFARILSGGLLSTPRAVLIGFFSLLLAILSYYCIEQPFRRSVTPPARLFAGYATAVALLGIAPLIGYRQAGWPNRVPGLVKAEVAVRQVERNVCLAGFEESKPYRSAPCISGGSGPKVALLGDSHAASLGSTVRQLALRHGYGFELLTKAGCPPLLDVTLRLPFHPGFERTCAAFNGGVLQQIASDPSIKVVFLAGFWSSPYLAGGHYFEMSDTGQEDPAAGDYNDLHTGLLHAIVLLRSKGKRVVVATDVPRFRIDPMSSVRNNLMKKRGELATLVSSHVFTLEPVSEGQLITPADVKSNQVVRRAAAEGGAEIVDLAQNLCPASHCIFWNNGVLLYSDVQHITAAGAEFALGGQDPLAIN